MSLLEFPSNWFEQVESSIIRQYKDLQIKGDIDNSVLAGFILLDSNAKTIKVISLATGTKLMSGDQRKQTAKIGAALIHDCHAEILSHRGLQAWVWDHLDSEYFELSDGKYRMRSNFSIHLYTSDPPCGDCCVHVFDNSENDSPIVSVQTGAKPFGWDQSQLSTSPPSIVRGKPGRGSRSQSVSCSDKITLWIHIGLQGSLLSKYISFLSLSSIVVGNGNLSSCQRALIDRITSHQNIETISPNLPKIFVSQTKWEEKNLSPSASSLVWWDGAPKKGELIAAKFGRKLGVTEKKQGDPRFFSTICDALMLKRFCIKNEIKQISLHDAKKSCVDYQKRKEDIKTILIGYEGVWATKFSEELEWEYKITNIDAK